MQSLVELNRIFTDFYLSLGFGEGGLFLKNSKLCIECIQAVSVY